MESNFNVGQNQSSIKFNLNSFLLDVCQDNEFPCGATGFCIEASGECDGFHDCVINQADERICGKLYVYSIT